MDKHNLLPLFSQFIVGVISLLLQVLLYCLVMTRKCVAKYNFLKVALWHHYTCITELRTTTMDIGFIQLMSITDWKMCYFKFYMLKLHISDCYCFRTAVKVMPLNFGKSFISFIITDDVKNTTPPQTSTLTDYTLRHEMPSI